MTENEGFKHRSDMTQFVFKNIPATQERMDQKRIIIFTKKNFR